MLVTIHQPEHLPWLGFFDKVMRADCLVLLDDVAFRKNYFQNRNRVRSADGSTWITVPVLTRGNYQQNIVDVRINEDGSPRWRAKYWGTIEQSYRKTPFWSDYAEPLRSALETKTDKLCELNVALLEVIFRFLRIDIPVLRSSAMDVAGDRTGRLVEICASVGATGYLSGVSGAEYLERDRFQAKGIELQFHEFHHPIYKQRHEPFMPLMSVIDLLFNHGPSSRDMIRGVGVDVIEEVFQ